MVSYFNQLRTEQQRVSMEALQTASLPPAGAHTVHQALNAPQKEQARLHELVIKHEQTQVERMMIKRNRQMQYISSQQLGASAVWEALPSSPKLRLNSEHVRIALCLRLCRHDHGPPQLQMVPCLPQGHCQPTQSRRLPSRQPH